jgi:hypothetical protein
MSPDDYFPRLFRHLSAIFLQDFRRILHRVEKADFLGFPRVFDRICTRFSYAISARIARGFFIMFFVRIPEAASGRSRREKGEKQANPKSEEIYRL